MSLYFYKTTDKAKLMKYILQFTAVPVPIHAQIKLLKNNNHLLY